MNRVETNKGAQWDDNKYKPSNTMSFQVPKDRKEASMYNLIYRDVPLTALIPEAN